jgi:hypothetical protein
MYEWLSESKVRRTACKREAPLVCHYHGFSSSNRVLLFFPPPPDQESSVFLPHPPKPKPDPEPSFFSVADSPEGAANGLARNSAGCGRAGGAARGGIPEFEGVDHALNPNDEVEALLDDAAETGGEIPLSRVYEAGEMKDGEATG